MDIPVTGMLIYFRPRGVKLKALKVQIELLRATDLACPALP